LVYCSNKNLATLSIQRWLHLQLHTYSIGVVCKCVLSESRRQKRAKKIIE
jgi:hypothetical protein